MSIQTTEGAVVLLDTVTGLVLTTPACESADEAEAFQRWAEDVKGIEDLRTPTDLEMIALSQEWMTLLVEHDEAVCPWDIDRDSYGMGFTGDSDREYHNGDPTEAVPNSCNCECHKQPGGVFHPDTRR